MNIFYQKSCYNTLLAAMVKLVYTQDLKSCALNKRGGSIPSGGTSSVKYTYVTKA